MKNRRIVVIGLLTGLLLSGCGTSKTDVQQVSVEDKEMSKTTIGEAMDMILEYGKEIIQDPSLILSPSENQLDSTLD